jgi:hypothetical protein
MDFELFVGEAFQSLVLVYHDLNTTAQERSWTCALASEGTHSFFDVLEQGRKPAARLKRGIGMHDGIDPKQIEQGMMQTAHLVKRHRDARITVIEERTLQAREKLGGSRGHHGRNTLDAPDAKQGSNRGGQQVRSHTKNHHAPWPFAKFFESDGSGVGFRLARQGIVGAAKERQIDKECERGKPASPSSFTNRDRDRKESKNRHGALPHDLAPKGDCEPLHMRVIQARDEIGEKGKPKNEQRRRSPRQQETPVVHRVQRERAGDGPARIHEHEQALDVSRGEGSCPREMGHNEGTQEANRESSDQAEEEVAGQ